MTTGIVLSLGLLLTALPLAGCLGSDATGSPTPSDADAVGFAAAEGEPTVLEWAGYLRLGIADRFAHMSPTDTLVEPLAKMGFLLDVPAGATALEFRLAWPEGVWSHFMMHGPEDANMPTYMMDVPDGGAACIRIPDDEVLPGVWKVMAHGPEDATNVEFTITSIVGGADGARILDEPHGHDGAGVMMMDMEMREPATCEPA